MKRFPKNSKNNNIYNEEEISRVGWNYRVVHHPPSKYKIGDVDFDRDEYLAIHEVCYDGEGKPTAMTIKEIIIGDEGKDSLNSLKWILENQIKALKKPILNSEFNKIDSEFNEINKETQNDFSKSIKTKE